MALKMLTTDVIQLSEGVWKLKMPPHQVHSLGKTQNSEGKRSVILVKSPSFDNKLKELQFSSTNIIVLNTGTSSEAICISASNETIQTQENSNLSPLKPTETIHGPGDIEFLNMCSKDMSTDMYATAKELLENIRKKSSGDLKKGQKRNFSETPDNFWYVIVQPRADKLQITVRGTLEHFSSISKLEIKDDRGNTKFKVSSKQDIPEALKLIFHAKRQNN